MGEDRDVGAGQDAEVTTPIHKFVVVEASKDRIVGISRMNSDKALSIISQLQGKAFVLEISGVVVKGGMDMTFKFKPASQNLHYATED